MGWRYQSADDIRTGWERADMKLSKTETDGQN